MASNPPYPRTPTGDPVFADSLVLFLDLLGVKDLATSAAAPGVLADLDRILRKVRQRTQPGWGFEYAWFSDSLAIAFPITTWHGENEFFDVLDVAENAQFDLALAGFPTRGGFARGNFFMDDNVSFGPALVEAVGLESAASSPRVLLSPEVVALARSHFKFYGNQPSSTPHSHSLVTDDQGNAFINYLDAARNYYSGDDINDLQPLFDDHLRVITRGLVSHQGNPNILQKYEWMARYHNWYCLDVGLASPLAAGFQPGPLCRFS